LAGTNALAYFVKPSLKKESYITLTLGGTATGGGTFWGLGRLLTKAKGFDEVACFFLCILLHSGKGHCLHHQPVFKWQQIKELQDELSYYQY
jgi:hypothetical protein